MADTIGSVRQHVAQAVASKRKAPTEESGKSSQEIIKANQDKANWEWVEVPDYDLFGEAHTGVSINFEQFGPGKYFVSPELATEIRRLLFNRLRGDMRVMQPNQDVKMAQIMQRGGKRAPIMNDDQMASELHRN
jgi:hypothetical protein